MKKKYISVLFAILAFSAVRTFSEKTIRAEDFSLTITPVGVTSLRRGIMLDVNVKYLGEQSIDAFPLHEPLVNITFEAPSEWNAKSTRPVVMSGVSSSAVTLRNSDSVGVTTFLAHYLSCIKPGEVILNAKLRVSSPDGAQAIILETQVPLSIINESNVSLRKHVDELAQQIKDEKDFRKRTLIYRQLLFISSDNVAEILLRGLQDKNANFLYAKFRQKIVTLSYLYGNKEIVKYLLVYADSRDEGFFIREGKGVDFSAKEWEQLRYAKNIWVRLYAINHRPISSIYTEKDKLDDITSPENIINKMKQYCKEIREKGKGKGVRKGASLVI